jgi:hypothetical protein
MTVHDYLVLRVGKPKARIYRASLSYSRWYRFTGKREPLPFGNANVIPPGSTVVVPCDLRPFDLFLFLRDATQITSQLAITAIRYRGQMNRWPRRRWGCCRCGVAVGSASLRQKETTRPQAMVVCAARRRRCY